MWTILSFSFFFSNSSRSVKNVLRYSGGERKTDDGIVSSFIVNYVIERDRNERDPLEYPIALQSS